MNIQFKMIHWAISFLYANTYFDIGDMSKQTFSSHQGNTLKTWSRFSFHKHKTDEFKIFKHFTGYLKDS